MTGRRRRQRVLTWAIIATSTAAMLAGTATWNQEQNPWMIVPIAVYAVIGAVLSLRRPENVIGWIFLGLSLIAGLLTLGFTLSVLGYDQVSRELAEGPAGSTIVVPWWGWLGAWLGAWTWYPTLVLMTVWTYLFYPSGLPSRRWRPVFWASAISLAGLVLLAMTQPALTMGNNYVHVEISNPASPSFMSGMGRAEELPLFRVLGSVAAVCGILAVVSVFVRARHSKGLERLQLRWFAFGAGLMMVAFILSSTLPVLGGVAGDLLFASVITLSPMACGIAILRYRLYDIDRLISRTTSYFVVTGMLVGIFVLIVTSVSRLLPSDSSSLAVAAATLTAAALVRPLLTRVQRVVDRRFNRERVDGQRAVEAFGAELANEVDPDHARDELLAVTRRSLAPASASLWVREGSR
jgi:hypothetical protein